MRKYWWAVLLLLVVSLGSDADAQSSHEVWYTFYDACVQEVGWKIIECGGNITSDGAQTGTYRLMERFNCSTGSYFKQWARMVDGNWVNIDTEPQPC